MLCHGRQILHGSHGCRMSETSYCWSVARHPIELIPTTSCPGARWSCALGDGRGSLSRPSPSGPRSFGAHVGNKVVCWSLESVKCARHLSWRGEAIVRGELQLCALAAVLFLYFPIAPHRLLPPFTSKRQAAVNGYINKKSRGAVMIPHQHG